MPSLGNRKRAGRVAVALIGLLGAVLVPATGARAAATSDLSCRFLATQFSDGDGAVRVIFAAVVDPAIGTTVKWSTDSSKAFTGHSLPESGIDPGRAHEPSARSGPPTPGLVGARSSSG
jgi:hypothetical protein